MENYQIQTTTDYDQFSFIKGNRKIVKVNLNRIIESMRDNTLFTLILVNESMQIIDGQHRFLALKELKQPVNYLVLPGYSVNEIHILNTNSSNWKRVDYLQGYVDMGLRPYVQFKQFMEQYPDFGIKSALNIVHRSRNENSSMVVAKQFEKGELIIKDIEYAKKVADIIYDYKPFYPRFFNTSFVIAVATLFKHKNYDHKKMLSKLASVPDQITDQTNSRNYVMLLEDIFNRHSRQKVSLRY